MDNLVFETNNKTFIEATEYTFEHNNITYYYLQEDLPRYAKIEDCEFCVLAVDYGIRFGESKRENGKIIIALNTISEPKTVFCKVFNAIEYAMDYEYYMPDSEIFKNFCIQQNIIKEA